MNAGEISQRLESALDDMIAEERRHDAVEAFMGAAHDLFLLRASESADLPDVAAFVEGHKDELELYLAAVDLQCVGRLEALLNSIWEGGEWARVCRYRSAIETVNEIVAGVIDEDYLLDAEDADEMIRRRGADEGFLDVSEIPPGTPKSHWWWYVNQR